MYWFSDVTKAVEAAIHRLHCVVFGDDEWGFDDYVELYSPLVLFITFETLVWFIAHVIRVYIH